MYKLNRIPVIAGLLLLISINANAQSRYKVSEPEVTFFAGTPLEDIDANSDKLAGVIDAEKKTFAFRIAMNTFQFKRELMQEHYNENYLETDKYPNADFKGSIKGDFDLSSDGVYQVQADGMFTIHDVEKAYDVPATITVRDGKISILAKFPIQLEDHNIDRPKIVLMKIAEKADVTVTGSLVAM